jgi:hypothetical protein
MTDDPELQAFEPFYPAIGRAIVAWAALEIKVDELLLSMLSHEKAKATRTSWGYTTVEKIPKSFRTRLKLCNDLAPIFYLDEQISELRSITKACGGQFKTRNRLAHGEWMGQFTGKKTRIVSQIKRFGLRGPDQQFTVKRINGLTATYHSLTERLIAFSISHHPDGSLSERLKKFFRSLKSSHDHEVRIAMTLKHQKTLL